MHLLFTYMYSYFSFPERSHPLKLHPDTSPNFRMPAIKRKLKNSGKIRKRRQSKRRHEVSVAFLRLKASILKKFKTGNV